MATTGADGLAAATISKSWVIIGKPINPAYSGTDEPSATPRQPIATPQKDLPILAYIAAGLFAIVRIRCAIRTYGLAKYVVDMVEDHFVVEHEVCRLVLAGQCWRSYLRSRVTFGLYGGMIKR